MTQQKISATTLATAIGANDRFPLWDSASGLWRSARGSMVYGENNAFSLIRKIVDDDSGDAEILVIGDSTGDATDEWPYLFCQWLGATYPTHTLKYSKWNDGSDSYPEPSTVTTGTGANTITLYNASVSGSTPQYLMGAKFSAAIAARDPDLIIWNHGHNLTTQTTSVRLGRYIGPCEQVRKEHPGVPNAMFVQNPWRDATTLDEVISSLKRYAAMRGDVTLLDVYSKFASLEKSYWLYLDSIHPNANGQALFLDVLTAAWSKAAASSGFTVGGSWLDDTGGQLLLNGDFSAFGGALPDSWTQGGDGTVTKDTTIVAPGSAHSVKIVNGAAATYITQSITANPYRGGTVTLAVRMYIEATGSINTGRVRVSTNGASPALEVNSTGSDALNGWRWVVIPGVVIPADATTLSVLLYASSVAGGVGTVYYDRAILVSGDKPENM